MAWTALTNNVLNAQHAGTSLKRFIINLIASFVYETKNALAAGLEVSMVTIDV